ncbi:MAG TPA: DUF1801 domain-containing protein [Gaiella sp.]
MSPTKSTKKSDGFTAEERAAMKARARELKSREDGESAVRAAIAAMSPQDRGLAERVHELVTTAAPELSPKTWYGMPAYAKDGKVVCYFRDAGKFKERYAMLGFNDSAKLDQGSMWPVAFALTELAARDERTLTTLVKKAVS